MLMETSNTHQRTPTTIQIWGLHMVKRVFGLKHMEYEFLDKEQLQKIYLELQYQKQLHIELVSEPF